MSTDNHDEQNEQGTGLGARKGDAITEQQQKALDHQAKYDQMMRLADLFDASGDEMRTRAALGNQVLNDEAVSASAELSPKTFSQAEQDIVAATTGKSGLMVRSVELDADALIVRATVLTYQWIDDLQDVAYKTLGSIAARAVGYLAPEVALGGAIFSAGLIETDALDRDGLASYLNELADANPELMDHFVSGGGGLIEGLQMRAMLTAAVLGSEQGPAVTQGGLRAVGAPEFGDDFSSALRDMAGGVIDASESATESATNDGAAAPRSIEDLMTSLSQVDGDLLVQKLPGGRYIAYLPSHGRRGRATLQLVGSDVSGRVSSVLEAIEAAVGDDSGARVMVVGHAQGGVAAAEIAAAAASDKFVIDQVITAGAPAAQVTRVPEGTTVLALEDRADPVALLGSLINAGVANRLTVVFDGGQLTGTAAYVEGGRAADTATHPELRAAIARIHELGYLAG
ncbi:hypothetical protein BJ980_001972 [Nocardioides daedukensis]|uniref:Alpha/beta hydrolase n=1 Tax=Nocardioides daedukensis TaxID=634462 RepID=A0A7Y9S3H8_9ACTN|nr:hypothetical protein [Nocardioides daedukensis]NYG59049.1 hypothetical protein [Nocardioides daedukensis]